MKKQKLIRRAFRTLMAFVSLATLIPDQAPAAPFTPGNIVVYRCGTGTGNEVNSGNAVFIDEYTITGTLVQSVALPTTKNGSQFQLLASGTATSEGGLTRSVDGRYVVCTGYGTNAGGGSLPGTTSATVPRVIGRVDALGNVDTSTALTDWTSGNNPRCAVTVDGTAFWGAGAGGNSLIYAPLGATTSTSMGSQNTRVINIYSNQLYISTSTAAKFLDTVGTGEPTSGTQTITPLTGITNTSAYGFVFFTLNGGAGPDTVYVADDGSGVGILKYCLVGGTWVNKGSITAAAVRGLCGANNGNTVNLYGATGGSGATGGGTIYAVTDTAGYNAAPSSASATSIATASANTAFRGIAFAPVGYGVTYNGNASTGGTVPTDSTLYTAGATVTVAGNTGSLVKTGYTFAGWNTAADGSGTSYSPGNTFAISANTTLYAQWTINTYTVSYDGNGNTSGTAPIGGTFNYNTSITVSNQGTLVKSSSSFTGWNTAANGSGTAYAAGSSLTVVANTTLYAQWANSPTISISGGPLNFGAVPVGGASLSQSYSVSGANLTAGIVIGSSSPNFMVSTDNSTFTSTVTLTPASGVVASTTIYVQFDPTAQSTYSSTVTNTTFGGSESDVLVSGLGANAPAVATQAATGIATNGATLNGTVTSSNNAVITDRGFYYKTSPGITTADTQVDEGGTAQSTFSKAVTGLDPNQIYYYRAYAINAVDATLDSGESSFYTLANTPATPVVSSPSQTSLSVTIGTGDGNPATTVYAIQETASGDYVQANGTLDVTAVYQTASSWGTVSVTGLTHGVFYKFHVKAQNGASVDSAFGPVAGASTTPLAFTPANLIVERIGNGSQTLAAAGNTIYLEEFTASGGAVQSIQIPDSGTTSLIDSGTAGSDGGITRSSDGLALVFPGYNTSQPFTSSVTGASGTAVPRGVGIINASGSYTLAAISTTANSGNNIRGAASDDSGNYWCSGAASGISYLGSGTPATVYSTVSNLRCVNIFGPNLWFSTASGSTTRGIWEFTGTPTAAATPMQIIPLGANDSVYNFAVDNPTNPTTIYYADDGTQGNGSGAGIHKWSNGGGGWAQDYVVYSGAGVFGLAVDWSTSPATIYATTTNSANSLLQIVDNGAGSSATVLATAASGEFYRGITFTPKGSQTITFGALADSTFGDADFALGATANSGLAVSYSSSDPTVATVTGNTVHILKAGSTTITASQAGNDFYLAATPAQQTLTVNKATPTATLAINNSPVTYSGGALSATVIISTSSTPGSVQNIQTGGAAGQTNVGTYAVTADFVPDDTADYNSLTGIAVGNFVISPASLSITANSTNKLFGQTLVFAGTEFTSSGLLGLDSISSVTLSSAGAASSATAGAYPIVPSAASGSGLGNYTIAYNNGTLTVTGNANSQFTSIVVNPDSTATLTLTGGPLLTYRIRSTADLGNPSWTDIGTVTTDSLGSGTFHDTNSVAGVKFYRAVYP